MKTRSWITLVVLLVAMSLAAAGPPARAGSPVTVNVTILRIVEINCDDNDVLDIGDSCGNDYYVKAFIDGQERVSPRAPDDATVVEPYWQLKAPVDSDRGTIGVRLQLWDHDSTSGDDLIDIKTPGDSNLDFTVNLADGTFQVPGQPANTGFGAGSGDDSARILFTVSLGDNGDVDGDGIPNGVEMYGVIDDNGTKVLDLRAKGANPCRKDIAVEVDYMDGPDRDGTPGPDYTHRPLATAQAEVIAAFSAAPIAAPVGCTFPGFGAAGGINFIWLIDQELPFQDKVDWNNGGNAIRDANFNAALLPYVAYSLWNHNQPDQPDGTDPDNLPDTNSSSGLCCGNNGKSVLVSLGQWTNGTGTARQQSGTLMHELGHALGLAHGGNDTINCKPNYLSVESYVYQGTGIPDTALPAPTVDLNRDGKVDNRDRFRLDYSRSALPLLNENSLIEGNGIGDGTDQTFWRSANTGVWNVGNGNTWIDWNGNKIQDAAAVGPIDINNLGIAGSQGCPNPSPGQTLNGFDDWQNLQYIAGRPGSAEGGSADHDRLTFETYEYVLAQIRAAQSTSDISLTMSDSPDPVAAGTNLAYTLVVHDNGPVPSYDLALTDTLPNDASFVSASAGCAHASGTVTCTRQELAVGSDWTVTITVSIPADLVYRNGGPKTISNAASVQHDGTDPVVSNNSQTATTQVVAVADVKINSLTTTSPLELIIGQPAPATVDVVVDNGGPSSPVDAVLTGAATAGPGAGVTPTSTTANLTALAVGIPRTVSQTFTLSCTGPGVKTISFTYQIALAKAADTDPDLTNNTRSASFQIDCVVPVAINIRPGGFPNSINLNTDATLAVLTTRAGEYGLPLAFDARTINIATVRFGLKVNLFNVSNPRGAIEIHLKNHLEDSYELNERTRDGDLDGVMHFKPSASGLTKSSTEGCVKGTFTSGGATYTFLGCDSVKIQGQ